MTYDLHAGEGAAGAPPADPVGREIAAILELCDRALRSRDLALCSPLVRRLIEREIPRLAALAERPR